MRFLKYIAVVLVVTAIAAVALHLYRESIARTFANRILKDQNIVVTDLAIQSLRTDHINLSSLELEQEDGSRFILSGLVLPLDFPAINSAELSIEKLQIIPASSPDTSPSLAPALQSFLQLPDNIQGTGISLASVELAGMPEIRNVEWQSESGSQHLTMHVSGTSLQVTSGRLDGNQGHQVSVVAGPSNSPDALSLNMSIRPAGEGFSVEGRSSISLSPWLPVLKSFALLPVDILSVSGRLSGPLQVEIGENASADLQLLVEDEWAAEYALNDARRIRVRTTAPATARISAAFPSARWTASTEQIDLEVSSDGIDTVPLGFRNVQCLPGISCSAILRSRFGPLDIGAATVEEVEISAALGIAKGEHTNITVEPGPILTASHVKAEGYSVLAARASLVSPANFSLRSGDWQGDANELRIDIDTLTGGDEVSSSFPLTLNEIRVLDAGSAIESEYSVPPQAGGLLIGDFRTLLPGISGNISLTPAMLTAHGNIADQRGGIGGALALSHSLENGSGELRLEKIIVDFAAAELSSYFLEWPYTWDLVTGTWSTDAGASWHESDTGSKLSGTVTGSAQSLAGNYDDIVFAGVSTELNATISDAGEVSVAPASMQMSLVEIGVPVRQISADYSVDLSQQAVDVENMTMSLLGGRLHADPFRFSARDRQTSIVLRPEAIQLQFMVELAEFKDIELSGSISGVLPVAIDGNTITITDGRLQNDPPGGVIRYLPGLNAGESTLNLVSRALANFQFDSLTSTVNYNRDGDLVQRMRLEGMNPDMDDRQPVILNLNVENNIPSMLRSLQATRSIEEILERRSTR